MAKMRKPRNALEVVIDFRAGRCEQPVLVQRGVIYAVFREAGETDFIASALAFRGADVDALPTHDLAAFRALMLAEGAILPVEEAA